MSADLTTREWIVQAMYLAASVLFILALRGLSSPGAARRGPFFSMQAMTGK